MNSIHFYMPKKGKTIMDDINDKVFSELQAAQLLNTKRPFTKTNIAK